MKLKSMFNEVTRFALVCSGANLKILDEECSSEQPKYTMIGTFIFLTSIFATFSGGYALHKGFKSVWLAILIGMLWGTFIFNVDRFIISTIRKKDIDPDLPFYKRFLLRWEGGALRLFLAFLISLVISIPLELKYFEPEIKAQMNESFEEQKNKDKQSALERDQLDIKKREEEKRGLKENLADKESRRDRLRDQSYQEAEGTGGTRHLGTGPVFRQRWEEYQKYEQELEGLRADVAKKDAQISQEISELAAKREEQIAKNDDARRANVGFLKELNALNRLAEESRSVWWARIFISVLILVLECTPILMKMMSGYGPYDSVLEAQEYAIKLKQQEIISNLNLEANHNASFNSRMNSAIQAVEEQLEQESMINIRNLAQTEIEKAMADVAEEVVKGWKTKHLENFASVTTSKNGKD